MFSKKKERGAGATVQECTKTISLNPNYIWIWAASERQHLWSTPCSPLSWMVGVGGLYIIRGPICGQGSSGTDTYRDRVQAETQTFRQNTHREGGEGLVIRSRMCHSLALTFNFWPTGQPTECVLFFVCVHALSVVCMSECPDPKRMKEAAANTPSLSVTLFLFTYVLFPTTDTLDWDCF